MVVDNQSWAINGRFLTQPMTGVQRYAFEISAALDAILAEEGDLARRLPIRLVLPPGAKTPAVAKIGVERVGFGSGQLWDQLFLPMHARAGLLSLGNLGPILKKQQIVCIHDANVFIQPESYSPVFGLAYRTLLPLIGRRAARIATVSQFSKDMLVKYSICNLEKIFVAVNGHEHALRWDASRANHPLLRTLNRPFVVMIGSAARHKNVEIICGQAEALDRAGIDVVVVGGEESIFAENASPIKQRNIYRAGYVSDDDLAAFYQSALCLVFPSKTEGFGIPPLEAMAIGCPVISSNAASLVEVGGEAVTYVDPDRGEKWREAIIGLASNTGLRNTMIERGRKRAAKFSWRDSAYIYLEEILRLSAPQS